jgi:hypothetical protein
MVLVVLAADLRLERGAAKLNTSLACQTTSHRGSARRCAPCMHGPPATGDSPAASARAFKVVDLPSASPRVKECGVRSAAAHHHPTPIPNPQNHANAPPHTTQRQGRHKCLKTRQPGPSGMRERGGGGLACHAKRVVPKCTHQTPLSLRADTVRMTQCCSPRDTQSHASVPPLLPQLRSPSHPPPP